MIGTVNKSSGKLSREGQTQRRQRLLEYITAHKEGVQGSAIMADLGYPRRSSLSDDIRTVNLQGEIIVSPKRGWYMINPEIKDASVRSVIDKAAVRRWMILALLSESPLSIADLSEELDDAGFFHSPATLQNDLSVLKDDKLITTSKEGRSLLYSSQAIYSTDKKEIDDFMKRYAGNRLSPQTNIESLSEIRVKATHAYPAAEDISSAKAWLQGGKSNLISKDLMQRISLLEQLNYKENMLDLVYTSNKGDRIECLFFTGLMVYSVETDRIYLLGENAEGLNTVIALHTVDFGSSKAILTKSNTKYRSKKYIDIYNQMFIVSMDEPQEVEVRFLNLPYLRTRVERLQLSRSSYASLEITPDGREFIYKDTLRGLDDFARYLRRFNDKAIVVKPQELKERMLYTSRKVIELYED